MSDVPDEFQPLSREQADEGSLREVTARNGGFRDRPSDELLADIRRVVRQELEETKGELLSQVESVKDDARETAQVAQRDLGWKLGQARSEMAYKGRAARSGTGWLAAAAAVGIVALAALAAAAVLALDLVLPHWLSALLVGLGLACVALAAALRGLDRWHDAQPLLPERTLRSMKEGFEWSRRRSRLVRR
jgi:hypothetical protein